jgi:uncharacterized membrane protein
MNLLNFFKKYPLMTILFIVAFVSITLIFIIGIYKLALVVLLSLIIGTIGYLLDRSQILNKNTNK